MCFSIRLEDEGRLADLTRSLKNEKQERKMADNNITQLQEELADLKSTKFSLEKVILMHFECNATSDCIRSNICNSNGLAHKIWELLH